MSHTEAVDEFWKTFFRYHPHTCTGYLHWEGENPDDYDIPAHVRGTRNQRTYLNNSFQFPTQGILFYPIMWTIRYLSEFK